MFMKRFYEGKKGLLRTALLGVLALGLMLFITLFSVMQSGALKKKSADAMASGVAVQLIGGSAQSQRLYDSDNNKFNTTLIQKFLNMLTNGFYNENQKATIEDLSNAIKNNNHANGATTYKCFNSNVLIAKAGAPGGFTTYLGNSNIQWLLVFVSQNTSTSPCKSQPDGQDVIATFWATQEMGYAQAMNSDTLSSTVQNMYALSGLRSSLTTSYIVDRDWDREYLIRPHSVEWQRTGTMYSAKNKHVENDFYAPDNATVLPGHVGWQDDTMWLPAVHEVYSDSYVSYAGSEGRGLWTTTIKQSSTTNDSCHSWLRSAYTNAGSYRTITGKGALSYKGYKNAHYVRPAVHLNLTKLANLIPKTIGEPIDLTHVYTGQAFNISGESVYASSYSLYTDPDVMKITPALEDMKNVGEYDVTFEIKAGNPKTAVWDNYYQTVGPKTVKFTVTRKKLYVSSYQVNAYNIITGITATADGGIPDGSPPINAFRFKYTDSAGGKLPGDEAAQYVKPTLAGQYRVYIELDSDKVDKNENLKNYFQNYEVVVDKNTCYKVLVVNNVEAPRDFAREYTGSAINPAEIPWYAVSQVYYNNASLMTISPALSTLKAIGDYQVTFTLRDNDQNIFWSDTGNFGAKTVTITIAQKVLTITDFTFNDKTEKVTSVRGTGYVSGDPLPDSAHEAFKIYYKTLRGDDLEGDPHIKPRVAGQYLVCLELDDAAVNNNYILLSYFSNYAVNCNDVRKVTTVIGVPKPQNITKTYTGAALDISKESWYSKFYDRASQDACVSYYIGGIINVGVYSEANNHAVTFSLTQASVICWTDGTTDDVIISVEITPRPVFAIVSCSEMEAPSVTFEGIIGNPQSGVLEGDTIPVIYSYADARGNVLDEDNPGKRPTAKGNYRVYVTIDSSQPNYVIGNNQAHTAFADFHIEGIPDPQDIHAVYTGKPIDITQEAWYNATKYTTYVVSDINDFIDCPDVLGQEYHVVSFRRVQDCPLDWSSGNQDAVVQIKLYIDPKPIDVRFIFNIEMNSLSVEAYDGEICDRDLGESRPTIEKKFVPYNQATQEEDFDHATTTEPTKLGTYHVYPIIDPQKRRSNRNYVIKQTTYYYNYVVVSELVATPTVEPQVLGSDTIYYTGSPIALKLTDESIALMQAGEDARIEEYVHNSAELIRQGLTYDSASHTFFVTEVGSYVVRFTLVSPDFTWDAKGGYMNIMVDKRELTLSDLEGIHDGMEANTDYTIRVKHDALADFDTIGLIFTYQRDEEDPVSLKFTPEEEGGDPTRYQSLRLNLRKTGTFKVTVSLAPAVTASVNKNYVVWEPIVTTMTLRGKEVNPENINLKWKYRNAITGTQEFDDDATVEFNSREYTVFVDQSNLADVGVKVLSYTGAAYTNANDSYTTYVRLTAYDSSWDYEEESIPFNWTIKRGLYNLDNVKWSYTRPFTYSGETYTITLKNLPRGLSASVYFQQGEFKEPGDYTAIAQFSSGDSNYQSPTQGDKSTYRYTGYEDPAVDFLWKLPCQIVQAEITPTWNMYGLSVVNEQNAEISIPVLYGIDSRAVTYTYHQAATANAVSNSNLFPAGTDGTDPTKLVITKDGNGRDVETWYYVKATIKTDWAARYKFRDIGTNPVQFSIGSSKKAIKINYTNQVLDYSGITITPSFTLDYANDSENGTFELPGLGCIQYAFYLGEIRYDMNNIPTDIGDYEIRFFLDSTTERDYYIKSQTSFTYKIRRSQINIAKIKWNYDPQHPFMYELQENGTPKMHSVELTGYNDEAIQIIYKMNMTQKICNEASDVGTYTAEFEIINLNVNRYEPITLNQLPENIKSIEWKIIPYEIPVPKADFKTTFDGAKYEIWENVGLPETYARYMTTEIKRNDQVIYTSYALNAGEYRIECTLLPELTQPDKVKVRWAEGGTSKTRVGRMTITPIVLTITGWQLRTSQAPLPLFEGEVDSVLYAMEFYYDRMPIGENELKRHMGEKLLAQVVPNPKYTEGNVVVAATSESTVSLEFYLFSTDPKSVKKPTLAATTLPYTGRMQQFNVNGFNATYMEYVGKSTLQRKDLGDDMVTIRLKAYQNVQWDDGTNSDVILTFSIVQGKLTPAWNKNGAYTISVPEEYEYVLEHLYYDEDGVLTDADSLESGKAYTVIARVRPEYESYFALEGDNSGNGITTKFTYRRPGELSGDEENKEVVELPLWQVIVSAVSVVFILIFFFMTVNYASAARKAIQKTRRLSLITYSVASILPLLMVTRGWLGLDESKWTIISLVLLGVALLMFIIMLAYRRKSIVAQDALEAEQQRVDEERAIYEEERRREEARQRDEDLRMMFAGLQSNYTAAANNMQSMLEGNMQQMLGAISAALPSGQPQYSELPPGQEEQQQQYTENYDELRDQIALQESMMNDPNYQQQDGYEAEPENYDGYDGYDGYDEYDQEMEGEDTNEDDEEQRMMEERMLYQMGTPATDDADRLPLEEAYNAMEERGRMLYYGLGGFIMNMPDMVQVDGNYEVLFKYRDRAVFKIYIKNNVPYLCYMLDNGALLEASVEDDIALQNAKEIIKLCLKRASRNYE